MNLYYHTDTLCNQLIGSKTMKLWWLQSESRPEVNFWQVYRTTRLFNRYLQILIYIQVPVNKFEVWSRIVPIRVAAVVESWIQIRVMAIPDLTSVIDSSSVPTRIVTVIDTSYFSNSNCDPYHDHNYSYLIQVSFQTWIIHLEFEFFCTLHLGFS